MQIRTSESGSEWPGQPAQLDQVVWNLSQERIANKYFAQGWLNSAMQAPARAEAQEFSRPEKQNEGFRWPPTFYSFL